MRGDFFFSALDSFLKVVHFKPLSPLTTQDGGPGGATQGNWGLRCNKGARSSVRVATQLHLRSRRRWQRARSLPGPTRANVRLSCCHGPRTSRTRAECMGALQDSSCPGCIEAAPGPGAHRSKALGLWLRRPGAAIMHKGSHVGGGGRLSRGRDVFFNFIHDPQLVLPR